MRLRVSTYLLPVLATLILAGPICAQIDYTGQNAKPIIVRDFFPGNCQANVDLLIRKDQTPGSNLYLCSADGHSWVGATGTSTGGGISSYTIATLPTSTAPDTIAQVKDATSSTDCSVGGGSVRHLCTYNGSAWIAVGGGGSGTVTTTTITPANGFTGTVTNPSTTPTIAIGTTINGVVKGTGSAIAPAAASDITTLFSSCTGTMVLGADGACHTPNTGTVTGAAISTANGFTGTVTNPNTNPTIAIGTNVNGVVKGNGSAITSAAAADITNLFSGCTGTLVLSADGTCHAAGTGTVTGASVTPANGFTGTVTNPSTTPTIAIGTTITGIVKGNGSAITQAASSDITNLFTGCTGTLVLAANGTCVAQTSIATYTVSTLPASPATNTIAQVTDGVNATDCTTGGGSTRHFCTYNGSTWVVSGGGGATVSGTSVLKGSGGNAVAAASSDITGLFTGCSGSLVLSANGTCVAPGGVAANSAVTDTATPTYTVLANTSSQGFTVDLTPGVAITGGTLIGTNATDGELITFSFGPQPSTPVSVTFPSNVIGAGTVDQTVGATSTVTCKWVAVSSTAKLCGVMSSDASTPKIITPTGTITLPTGSSTMMSTTTLVTGSQLPALTGDLSSTAGSVSPQVTATHLSSPLPISQGGLASTTAPAAASNLGVAPGTTSTPIVISNTSGELNTLIAGYPAKSTVILLPGTYRITQAITFNSGSAALPGITLIGQPGVIIKGSQPIATPAWTGPDGNGNYHANSLVSSEYGDTRGSSNCNSGITNCEEAIDLFMDWDYTSNTNAFPLVRDADTTGSPSSLIAGHWAMDRTTSPWTVYIHVAPSGHVFEEDVLPYAFTGDTPNITMKGIVVSQFSSDSQIGCVGAGGASQGWRLEEMDISGCHSAAFRSGGSVNGSNITVIKSRFHHNGQEGGGAYTGSDITYDRVTLDYNNYRGYNGGGENGGAKFTGVSGLNLFGLISRYNSGVGLWFDGSVVVARITGCQIDHNTGNGIQDEVSHGVLIQGCTIGYNGTVGSNPTSSQVYLYNSDNPILRANTIQGGSFGTTISINNDSRGGDGFGQTFLTRNAEIVGNHIYLLSGATEFTDFAVVLGGNLPAAYLLGLYTPSQMLFDYNDYHLPDFTKNYFGGGVSGLIANGQFSGWHQVFDLHSTVDTDTVDASTANNGYFVVDPPLRRPIYQNQCTFGRCIVDLALGNMYLVPTGPITELGVFNSQRVSPFTVTVKNGATVYPVAFNFSWTGALLNSVASPNTICKQLFEDDPGGFFHNAVSPASCTQYGALTADDFNGIPGTGINGNPLRLNGSWASGYGSGGANALYSAYKYNASDPNIVAGAVNTNNTATIFSNATLPTGGYTVQANFLPTNTVGGNEIFGVVGSQGTISDNTAGYGCRYNGYVPGYQVVHGDGTIAQISGPSIVQGVLYKYTCDIKTVSGSNNINFTVQQFTSDSTNGYYLNSSGAFVSTPSVAISVTGDTSQSATGSAGIYLRQNSGAANTQATYFSVTANH